MKYNYLDILNKRQLRYLPVHFISVKIEETSAWWDRKELVSWVMSKTKGRFSIGKIPMLSNDDKLKSEVYIGFEDHKELTYFILACPFFRRNK
jgi:hypothetical protein